MEQRGSRKAQLPFMCWAASRHSAIAVVTQWGVAGDEVERGFAELVAEFVELVGEIAKSGIRNKASDATQEREAGAFDSRVGAGLDQGECLRARRVG